MLLYLFKGVWNGVLCEVFLKVEDLLIYFNLNFKGSWKYVVVSDEVININDSDLDLIHWLIFIKHCKAPYCLESPHLLVANM